MLLNSQQMVSEPGCELGFNSLQNLKIRTGEDQEEAQVFEFKPKKESRIKKHVDRKV